MVGVRHVFGVKTFAEMLGDEAGVEVAGDKIWMRQQRGLKRNVRTDAANHKAVQRFAHFLNRIVAVASVHDQLGDHGVVVHGDFTALLHAGVDAHTQQFAGVGLHHGLLRRLEASQATGRRQEIAERVFSVDAALYGPAVALYIGLRERQFFTGGNADHPLNQIESGDAFGHRVFNL